MDRLNASPKILVVEDNKVTNAMITDFLLEKKITVDQAHNGLDALKLMEGNRYDIVISDIIMPGIDGIELLRRIKEKDSNQEVIMVTSSVDISHSIEAIKLKATDYIIKPIDFAELEGSVQKVLGKAKLSRLQKEHKTVLEFKMVEEFQRAHSVFYDAVQSLIHAIEARDTYTEGHSKRVTLYTRSLIEALELETEAAREIGLASQLHDIGKLGMSDFVLNKNGKLTEEEFDLMRKHPEVGYNILNPILPEQALFAVRHHHERWDGGGYPHGLAEDAIPLGARIIALADTFDAITSERIYRPARTPLQAGEEILRCSGTQFDPDLATTFTSIIDQLH